MDILSSQKHLKRVRTGVMAFLLVLACLLTYQFHARLRIGVVFTHFFYVPVALACVWWKKKGLVVAVFLAAVLIASHNIYRPTPVGVNDYFRAIMFMVVGLVVASLSERITRQHDLLRRSEARFQEMASSIPGMVFQFVLHRDGAMEFSFISEGCKDFFGVEQEEVQRNVEAFFGLMRAEDSTALRQSVTDSAESLSLLDYSGRMIVHDEEKWLRALARPARLQSGDTFWNGMFVDITEVKRAEERLLKYQGRLKKLAAELSQAEQRERRRIAMGLHDDVGQNLSVLKMHLQALRKKQTDPSSAARLDEMIELADKSIVEVGTLTFELSPAILFELGLGAAVEWLIEQFRRVHNLRCDFRQEGEEKPLDDDLRATLFRALKELLINVVKHAGTDEVHVLLKQTEGQICLIVDDNGIGFDPSRQGAYLGGRTGGFGLFSIEERLGYVGGTVKIESKPEKGTRITLTAPLEDDLQPQKRESK